MGDDSSIVGTSHGQKAHVSCEDDDALFHVVVSKWIWCLPQTLAPDQTVTRVASQQCVKAAGAEAGASVDGRRIRVRVPHRSLLVSLGPENT